jgi:uncharacterized protein (TIGR03083 family)
MDPGTLLTHLRRELGSFAACLAGDLSAPVPGCGTWTLWDLADHLGRSNQWVVTAVTERRGDHQAPAAPREPAELTAWFDRTSTGLLTALGQDPAREAWTIWPPRTVGFWQRRRSLETLVHRWDAESALGAAGVLDPALAGEGVAEVIDTIVPRQVALGRAVKPRRAVRLVAADTGASWVLGPGEPAAAVSAAAQSLLLMLWHRLPVDDPAMSWDGDVTAGRDVLAGTLVP